MSLRTLSRGLVAGTRQPLYCKLASLRVRLAATIKGINKKGTLLFVGFLLKCNTVAGSLRATKVIPTVCYQPIASFIQAVYKTITPPYHDISLSTFL